jgi:hypothetical protein
MRKSGITAVLNKEKREVVLPEIRIINHSDRLDISNQLLINGKLNLLSCLDYDKFNAEDLRLFCHFYGRYLLPTLELVEYVKDLIGNKVAIEIGAGCGDFGYHLGIKMTDSYVQTRPDVINYMLAINQPVTKYGNDVEQIDALDAIEKYKPNIVIGAWVTNWIDPNLPPTSGSIYGIKENEILKLVDTYIMIGSVAVHKDKPILKLSHETIDAPFVRSRRTDNKIWIWRGKIN